MKRLLRSEFILVIWRVALLYVVLALCRLVFYLYNYEAFAGVVNSFSEFMRLCVGCFKFDTVSIIYVNALWVLLSLLPIRMRAKKWYRNALFWLYITANSLFLITLNLSDAVYYRYTMRRFSNEELLFLDNDNTAGLALQFLYENWWMTLLGALVIWLLSKLYFRAQNIDHQMVSDARYYFAHSAILLIAVGAMLVGVRGHLERNRPITVADATLFTADPTKANLVLSNPFCVVRTLGKSTIPKCDYFSEDVVGEYFTPYHYPCKDSLAMGSKYEGYNVVVVIMESLSAEFSAHLRSEVHVDDPRAIRRFWTR